MASLSQQGNTVSESPSGISVVIPCYNEENAIVEVLDQLLETLEKGDVPFEIITVNDGSTDRTAEQIDPQRFRIVNHETNMGYGAALKTGASHAKYDCIVITDADGTYPNEMILELYQYFKDYEMVVGARVGEKVKIPLIRRPPKWVINQLANYLSGHKIPDINSGLRVIDKKLFNKYKHYYPDGFSLTTTITLASLVNHHRVKYIPINYHHRIGNSKIKPIRDTLNFVSLIVRTIIYFEPLKVFIPLSVGLFLASFLVGSSTLVLEKFFGIGKFMDVTTVLLMLSSIQLFAVGALADLINKRMR